MTYKGICLSLIMVSGVLMGCSKDASTSAPKEPAAIVSTPTPTPDKKGHAHIELSDEDIQSYRLNGEQLFITLSDKASRHLFEITTTDDFLKLKATWRGHIMALSLIHI